MNYKAFTYCDIIAAGVKDVCCAPKAQRKVRTPWAGYFLTGSCSNAEQLHRNKPHSANLALCKGEMVV